MKPFLLVQSRPEDNICQDEYNAYLRLGNLRPSELVAIRGEMQSLEDLSIKDYSGLIIGGGPFNLLDAPDDKTDGQKRLEEDLRQIITSAYEQDYPVLGVCYGMSLIVDFLGGKTSYEYGESIDAVEMRLVTEHADPLLSGLPASFMSFVGHKEACENPPAGTRVLLESDWCPIQMLKIKNNIYATQFHPEVDPDSLEKRILTYSNHGYFENGEMQDLIYMAHNQDVTQGAKIIKNFVDLYQGNSITN